MNGSRTNKAALAFIVNNEDQENDIGFPSPTSSTTTGEHPSPPESYVTSPISPMKRSASSEDTACSSSGSEEADECPLNGGRPAKKQSKWSPREDAMIIELRSQGMKWDRISKQLPGRSPISCRLHYQNYLEKRSVWDEERKNQLARLYERLKQDMWAKIARELGVPWRACEAMHWHLGMENMAQRAGVIPFSFAHPIDTNSPPQSAHRNRRGTIDEVCAFNSPQETNVTGFPSPTSEASYACRSNRSSRDYRTPARSKRRPKTWQVADFDNRAWRGTH